MFLGAYPLITSEIDMNMTAHQIKQARRAARVENKRFKAMMARGKNEQGKYPCGGSVMVPASHQRITAWKRDLL